MSFKKFDGFLDLNLCTDVASTPTLQNNINRVATLGYHTVAVGCTVNEELFNANKKKRRKTEGSELEVGVEVPDPNEIKFEIPKTLDGKDLNVLKRITVEISDPSKAGKLSRSANIRKYDLLAVKPNTAAAFQQACTSLEIDIIQICHETFSGPMMNRRLYKAAVERGIVFELQYSPAIRNPSARVQVCQNALTFGSLGKFRSVLLTSGAHHSHELRSPRDVINFGFVFGLDETQSKASITSLAKSVVIHGISRNWTGKCIVEAFRKDDQDGKSSVTT